MTASEHTRRIRRIEAHAATYGPYLTERQIEVLRLSITGATAAETAKKLGIGRRTVDYHRQAILAKCGAETMEKAVHYYCHIVIKPEYLQTMDLRGFGVGNPDGANGGHPPPNQTGQTWTNGDSHRQAAVRNARTRPRKEGEFTPCDNESI